MAVSYLSTTFKNSPYVPPLDLNLLDRVLSYKQGQFDNKALEIQNQLNQLSSLDVYKDEDRQYLTTKVNNLVGGLNGLGAVDLSDFNVSNQIERYGSDIYNDDKVINAVSSTKRIRNLQASYEKYRTDPKLSKYFSEANYTLDMANVNSYIGDGQVGSSYRGNSSATPFYDYNKEFSDIFSKIKADQYSQITPDGYYIRKSSGEYVNPEKVMEEARGLMSMNARSQMGRDAVYLYKYKAGFGKNELVNKALQIDSDEVSQIQEAIQKTKKDISLESDVKNKQQLKTNLHNYEQVLGQKYRESDSNKQRYERLYDTNPDELMYKGYSDDYFKALGLRYSYNQVKNDLVADPVKAMVYQAGERRYLKQSEINAAYNLQKLRAESEKDLEVFKAQADGKISVDPVTGEVTFIKSLTSGVIGPTENVAIVQPNTNEGDEEAYYDAAKQRRDLGINAEVLNLKNNYWRSLVSNNPELKIVDNQTFDFNKDGQVNLEDFKTDVMSKAGGRYPTVQVNDIIASAQNYLENLAEGKPVNVKSLPQGTAQLVEKMNLLNQEKKSLSDGIDRYDAGDKAFLRDNYGIKLISPEETVQKTPGISTIKSFIYNEGSASGDLDIISIGKMPNGSPGYRIGFKEKRKGKDDKIGYVENVPENIAQLSGVQAGPYDILNTTVDAKNDFDSYVQNTIDPTFVAHVRVFKDGNTNQFKASYWYHDSITNSSQSINLPIPPAQMGTPALAYAAAKRMIESYKIPNASEGYKNAFENSLKNYKR